MIFHSIVDPKYLVYSVCNRTWFGDTGKTYEMELDKPKNLPFVCHLNFTAAGGSHGDIIQVSTFSQFPTILNKFRTILFFFFLNINLHFPSLNNKNICFYLMHIIMIVANSYPHSSQWNVSFYELLNYLLWLSSGSCDCHCSLVILICD